MSEDFLLKSTSPGYSNYNIQSCPSSLTLRGVLFASCGLLPSWLFISCSHADYCRSSCLSQSDVGEELSAFLYRPRGYHPVHLGDTFKGGAYDKLGYGWLVKDKSFKAEARTSEVDVLCQMAVRSELMPWHRSEFLPCPRISKTCTTIRSIL